MSEILEQQRPESYSFVPLFDVDLTIRTSRTFQAQLRRVRDEIGWLREQKAEWKRRAAQGAQDVRQLHEQLQAQTERLLEQRAQLQEAEVSVRVFSAGEDSVDCVWK